MTVGEHLNSFEHRVRKLGPTSPDPMAMGQHGRHGCGERVRDGIAERASKAAHRREKLGLAETPSERQRDIVRPVFAVIKSFPSAGRRRRFATLNALMASLVRRWSQVA